MKTQFVREVDALKASLSPEALEFFENSVKAKRINKKAVEKAGIVKTAIVEFLQANTGTAYDRKEIADALYNAGNFAEEYLLNDKGDVAYNSITTYANQLVAEGKVAKVEVKDGKVKRVKYTI